MKISEVVIHQHKKTWEILKNEQLVNQMYELYEIFLHNTKNFSIQATEIFDEYKITDLIIDYNSYKKELLEIFTTKDQVIKLIDRIISYLEYNQLN